MQRLRVEGRLESAHLVEQNACRPNVGLKAVAFLLDYLRGQVVGRSHDCLGPRASVREDARNSEISELEDPALGKEDILRLEISVEDLLVMAVFESETDLREPVQHLIFGYVNRFPLCIFHFGLGLDPRLQVAIVSVVHDDAKFSFLCLVDFPKTCYVRVVEHLEDLGFFERFLPLLVRHLAYVDLLDHG